MCKDFGFNASIPSVYSLFHRLWLTLDYILAHVFNREYSLTNSITILYILNSLQYPPPPSPSFRIAKTSILFFTFYLYLFVLAALLGFWLKLGPVVSCHSYPRRLFISKLQVCSVKHVCIRSMRMCKNTAGRYTGNLL